MQEMCIACKSINVSNFGKPPLLKSDTHYIVLKCNECNLMWSYPMPTEEELTVHYNSYYERRFQKILNSSLKFFRDIITFKYIREYYFLKNTMKYSHIKKFLDYGCGEGEMLLIGKKFGWNCTGTEYSKELSDKYNKLGIKVVVARDFQNSTLEQNNFDLILFKHLFEHLKEIPLFLNQAKKYLRKNGLIAIKTPSNTSLRAKTKTANWHYVNPPEHLWSFNPHNFKLLLENNGFEVLRIRNNLMVDELICYAKVINNQ